MKAENDNVQTKLLSKLHIILVLYIAMDYVGIYFEQEEKLQNTIAEVPTLESQIIREKKKVELQKEFLSQRDESKSRIEDVAKDIETVQRQLPNTISDSEILGILSKEANAMNMQDLFLRPLTEEKRGFYFAKQYTFRATGTFLQFLIFFERLRDNPRLINVVDLKIDATSDPKKGRFKLISMETQLEVFRYNPAHREDRGISDIENQFEGS